MNFIEYIMSFDFGTKNIGIAIGQTITYTAGPINDCKVKNGIPDWNKIEFLIKKWNPYLLIVGLPLNMDGTEQPLTKNVKIFVKQMKKKTCKKVLLQDERLSTISAKEFLFNNFGSKGLIKKRIDSASAVLILENWFKNNINFFKKKKNIRRKYFD